VANALPFGASEMGRYSGDDLLKHLPLSFR